MATLDVCRVKGGSCAVMAVGQDTPVIGCVCSASWSGYWLGRCIRYENLVKCTCICSFYMCIMLKF